MPSAEAAERRPEAARKSAVESCILIGDLGGEIRIKNWWFGMLVCWLIDWIMFDREKEIEKESRHLYTPLLLRRSSLSNDALSPDLVLPVHCTVYE